MLERSRDLLNGGGKQLFAPQIPHPLALIAFFAWVGLGSDGLPSCAFRRHTPLALYLTAAMALTAFLFSAPIRVCEEQRSA